MRLFNFSCVLIFLTWVLLWIGGLVNPMGASLACPDWYFVPTCNGELLPAMTGGVLYEHGHRLWASMVGICTVILAVGIWRTQKDRVLRGLSLVAVLGVALQGALGGVTVLLGLNAVLSTMHLIVAMSFFCLLIYMSLRMGNALEQPIDKIFLTAFALTFVQILLGGLIRHVGAGMACGDDWLSCGPVFWPSWHLGQLHMLHRLVGYTLAVVIGWACVKQFQKTSLAWVPLILVIIQVILGLWTVGSMRSPYVVAMHTAIGALTLGSLWVLALGKTAKRLSA